MTGWRTLAATTIRLANEHGARVRQRPAADRLLCETVDEEPTERVRGILAAAYALSGEICEACGGPGDPVRTAAGRQTTRYADCREPADDSLARPPWRREREPEEDQQAPVRGFLIGSNRRTLPVVDDLVGTEDLAALMEAWYTHRPRTGAGRGDRSRRLRHRAAQVHRRARRLEPRGARPCGSSSSSSSASVSRRLGGLPN